MNISVSNRSNMDPRTRHSSTPSTVAYEDWLDRLQVFSHLGEVYINEKGKKDVMLNGCPRSFDKGWDTKKRDTDFPSTAIACILGEPSSVCVLDFDKERGIALYDELILKNYSDRCWPTVKTQRGYHVYFEYRGDTKEAFDSWNKAIEENIDIKRNGQIWFPGCRVKQRDGSYFCYEWVLHDALPNGVGLLCQMPSDLIDELTKRNDKPSKLHDKVSSSPKTIDFPRIITDTSLSTVSTSKEPTLDQKRVALITGEHVQDYHTWFQIMCAIRNSQCTVEDARALTARYLHASGQKETTRFDKLHHEWNGSMAKSKATVGSIVHHARQCNPEALAKLKESTTKERKGNEAKKIEYMAQAGSSGAVERADDDKESYLFDSEDEGATDLKLAQQFLKMEGHNLVYQQQVMHVYFESRWRVDHGCELLRNIYMRTMTNYLAELIKNCQSSATIKKASKCIHACQTPNKVNGMINAIKSELAGELHAVQFDVGADQHYNIQFANCVYDLKEKEARPRTEKDYVTQILDYDFIPRDNISDDIHDEVRRFFEKLQPDKDQRRFQLSYLAYCLTGNTSHQIMKMNIGYSASNGKSTELKVHRMCFPIYTTKLDKRTFNQNYTKAHKELIGLLHNPIRLAYIEELEREMLDVDLLKDVIDGYELSVEVLYATKSLARHQTKLMTCSNKDPNITADEGVKRRTKVQLYESRFVDGADDNEETHVYRKQLGFEERFSDPAYKNAYLHLLLEHVDELYIPESAGQLFTQIAEENDTFRNTLEVQYEVTGNEDDRVSKAELTKHFKRDTNMKWPAILSNLKRLGLKYIRDERIQYQNGIGEVVRDRGAIHGLKVRSNDEEADSNQTGAGEPSTAAGSSLLQHYTPQPSELNSSKHPEWCSCRKCMA